VLGESTVVPSTCVRRADASVGDPAGVSPTFARAGGAVRVGMWAVFS
jgi:hypothetical protein